MQLLQQIRIRSSSVGGAASTVALVYKPIPAVQQFTVAASGARAVPSAPSAPGASTVVWDTVCCDASVRVEDVSGRRRVAATICHMNQVACPLRLQTMDCATKG